MDFVKLHFQKISFYQLFADAGMAGNVRFTYIPIVATGPLPV